MAGEYIEFNNNSQPALNDTNINRLQQLIKQDIQGAVSGDTLPIGAIMPFGSDTIPDNWLLCNGQAVSRTDYQDLFNTIGITYGSGDGFTTFNLPDLQGKIPVGLDENDTDFDTLGNTGGEKEHTLTIDEIPSHSHNVQNNFWVQSAGYGNVNTSSVGDAANRANIAGSGNIATSGGGQSHNILQPYIVQNYIIKAKQSAGIVATVVDGLNSTSATNALSANQGRILNDRFNYSTTEKVVGTWIDGKPLYEITLVANKVSGSDLVIPIALNVDTAFVTGGCLISIGGVIYNLTRYENANIYTRIEIADGNLRFKSTTGNYENGKVIAILRYTKTTD